MNETINKTRRRGEGVTQGVFVPCSPCRRVAASSRSRALRAYTIIEVMVAAGILVVGIAAAASLALTMVSQEEANAQVARAFNTQEQAAHLYQLGLEPSGIAAILPAEPNVVSLTFDTSTNVVTNVGSVERADCEMIFDSGSPMASGGTAVSRTNEIVLMRPSIR